MEEVRSQNAWLSQVVVFCYLWSLSLCGFVSPLQLVVGLETSRQVGVYAFPVILSIILLAGILL